MHYIRIASHVFPILLSTANALTKLERENSANNFQRSFRGWTSFPLQAYNHPQHQEYGDDWFNEQHLREQADALSNKVGNGYEYFMLDSGWSADESDENGRIMPNSQRFADFKKFSEDIHAMGLKLGVYIVPGAFTKDILQDKAIANSDLKMGAINTACNITNGDPFPCAFGRTNLQYNQASREWVNSVVKQFADEWQIDLIKFDYIHPKQHAEASDCDNPDPYKRATDCNLPDDYSNYNDVTLWHDAITASNRQMWLLLSYDLDMSHESTERWRQDGDSYRIAVDVNQPVDGGSVGQGISTTVSWYAIQRMSEALRVYMSAQLSESRPIKGHADMDSLMIGNSDFLNQLNDGQRMTYMSLWVIAGAPLYLGDDLTKIDDKYLPWITKKEVLDIHDSWTSAESPGFYVSPQGDRNPSQLQIWEAGPFGDDEEVVVLLANMGCTENKDRYVPPWDGDCKTGGQNIVATWSVLQLQGTYCVRDVWGSQDTGAADAQVSKVLDEGQSILYRLTPNGKGGKSC